MFQSHTLEDMPIRWCKRSPALDGIAGVPAHESAGGANVFQAWGDAVAVEDAVAYEEFASTAA